MLLSLWTTSRSDAAVDDMIFTWVGLKKINYDMAIDGSQDQALDETSRCQTEGPEIQRSWACFPYWGEALT